MPILNMINRDNFNSKTYKSDLSIFEMGMKK
jgi:hypothetical protein